MSTLPGDEMALPSTFPAEIEDLIIDELHGDVWTLRQCALTCSGWLPRSRYNLYFSVRVDRKEKLLSLYSAITQYIHLRPLVRSVTLEPSVINEEAGELQLLYLIEIVPIPLLTLLPNLRHWSLRGRQFRKAKKTVEVTANMEGHGTQEGATVYPKYVFAAPPCDRMSLACLRRHSTTIQELSLCAVSFPTSENCARFLLSFSALNSLRCEDISVKTSRMIPDAWMNRVAGRGHIRSLSLRYRSDSDVINTILRVARSSVQTLAIDVQYTNDETLDILSRPFDNLHSLELSLQYPAIRYDEVVTRASVILDHISHPPGVEGSIRRKYTIVFGQQLISNDEPTIEACKKLEESLLRCSPHHIHFKYPEDGQRKRWLFWDRTMSTLFPVLYVNNMFGLESSAVGVKRRVAGYSHYGMVTAIAAAPDGLWITSGSIDGTIILWSMVDRVLSPVLDWGAHPKPITQLRFSPDGRCLASSSFSQIRIWDTMHGTLLGTLCAADRNSSPLYRVQSMVWSPTGTLLAYRKERTLLWWDMDTVNSASNQPSFIEGTQSSHGTSTAPSTVIPPNGSCRLSRHALAETSKQQPKDVAHPWLVNSKDAAHPGLVDSVFSSDGGRLITTYRDGSVVMWDISEHENIRPFGELSGLPLGQSLKTPGSSKKFYPYIGTSGSGREVLVRRSGDTSVGIWDIHTGTRIASLQHDGLGEVWSACISCCGKFAATGTYNGYEVGMVYLWRVSDGACLASFQRKRYSDEALFLMPDGQTLVYGSGGTVVCHLIGHLLMQGNAD